jgi:hypothetical protein
MVLLAMNWKVGTPSKDFVGFAIEYQEPGGNRFYSLNNRIGFLDSAATSIRSSSPLDFPPFRSSVGSTSRASRICPGPSSIGLPPCL